MRGFLMVFPQNYLEFVFFVYEIQFIILATNCSLFIKIEYHLLIYLIIVSKKLSYWETLFVNL